LNLYPQFLPIKILAANAIAQEETSTT